MREPTVTIADVFWTFSRETLARSSPAYLGGDIPWVKYEFGTTEFHVLCPKKGISVKYIYRIESNQKLRVIVARHMTVTSGYKGFSSDCLANCEISIPSLSIQNKKSKKLDKLHDLYNVVALQLRNVKFGIGVTKRAVLSEAFSQARKRGYHVQ